MRCRHFTLSPNPKKNSQRRNETEYKELKMKRNLISQKRKKEEETRVFMCAASRDCEADLTILDTVLVFSLPLSHSLSPLAVVSSSFVASLQSLLQSQPLWAARGCWPLLLYFLTSFMGCHVSNGNGNLCVCN